jgi:ABC-type sugar transport system ATPase subunit/ribose/xylose/arabinose/galactoside ABC-type transport system permease subunit
MTALLELDRIRKTFPGVLALDQVSLSLHPGTIHALVGENGAGKSTLINLLSGVLQPDGGVIRVAGQPTRLHDAQTARQLGIVTVHQEMDLFPDLTVAENMGLEQGLARNALGWVRWRSLRHRARTALAAIGEELSPTRLASELSPAQRQLVEMAAAVSQSARVLILDEPTSSLSEKEAQVLFSHLRRFRAQGTAILYVSHRLEEIFALADQVSVLRDGRHVWTGPISQSTPIQLVGLMVGREKTATSPGGGAAESSPLAAVEAEIAALQTPVAELSGVQAAAAGPFHAAGSILLRCEGLTAADGTFADINLEVRSGETLGVYGLIGAGRSEWAQALFGLRALAGGEVWFDGQPVRPAGPGQMVRRGLAYVPEDRLRQGLCRGLSVRANLVLASLRELARGLWLPRTNEVRRARTAVERLAIRLSSVEQPAATLSGGNQQKVVLGRWLGRDPKVLLLDEPTRGVDVGAKAEIHALVRRLAAEGRAIVMISSELPEVLAQSDRVAVFNEGRLAATFDPRRASPAEVATAALPAQGPAITGRVREQEPAGTGPQTSAMPLRSTAWRVDFRHFRELSLLAILVLLFAFLQWWTGRFLQAQSLQDLALETALLSYCAMGATLVILSGGIDISLGSLMALSAGVAGSLWEQGQSLPLVVGVAMLVGMAGGVLNAALSLVGRVHPIVVTLGTWSLFRGLTVWWLKEDLRIPLRSREWFVAPALGLPLGVWLGAVFLIATWLLLSHTVTGREFYALGSNPAAAHRVGIDRRRVWLKAFGLQGLLAGLAGFLYMARSGGLERTSFEDKTLEAIAAAVVGGVAITGGRGTLAGVVLGCLFLVTLPRGGIFLHIPPHWHRTLVGGVMVAAVTIDALWRRKGARN